MGENSKYNSELPRGWAVLVFKKTCDKISLNGIKIKQKQYLPVGEYPVVDQGQDIIGGYFNDGDLLVPDAPPYIVFGDHTKTKKYLTFRFIAGADGVKVLKPLSFFEPKLFYYFIHCIKLPDKGYARHFQFLERSEIPLPPLPDQHRIVAKIEELFSSLDKGIESLKTAQQQLKVYRQAVLKWSFEGKLTNKDVVDGELPEGWKWTKLSEIIRTLDQGWSPKCENKASSNNEEWAVIKTTAVQSGSFIETENKILPSNLEPREQHELKVGDILITRAGPRVRAGVCCMIKHVRPKLINCDKAYRIRVKGNEILSSFLSLALNSPDYSNEIEKMKTGISDSGVNLTQKGFLQLSIKLPPITEQNSIVSEIESRLSVCDKIEESIEQSLKHAESLRQSILKKAFEGKLVPQEPNDEPASVLLARIKAERERNKSENPPLRQTRKARTKKAAA